VIDKLLNALSKAVDTIWWDIGFILWCLGWATLDVLQKNYWWLIFWLPMTGAFSFLLYLKIKERKSKKQKEGNQ